VHHATKESNEATVKCRNGVDYASMIHLPRSVASQSAASKLTSYRQRDVFDPVSEQKIHAVNPLAFLNRSIVSVPEILWSPEPSELERKRQKILKGISISELDETERKMETNRRVLCESLSG
jgi:hypothetical protein